MHALVLPALLLLASPDAGAGNVIPQSPEVRALETQASLLRKEIARPREWHDRDKTERLKGELATLELVLRDLDEMYAARMAKCQQYWLQFKDDRFGTLHPGYFSCPEKAQLPGDLVRQVQRKYEVERRLKDKGIPVPTRNELRRELETLNVAIDKESGLEPLYLTPMEYVGDVDGGTPEAEGNRITAPPITQ